MTKKSRKKEQQRLKRAAADPTGHIATGRRVIRELCALAEACYPRSIATTGRHDDWNVTGPAFVARCTRIARAINVLPTAHESAAQVLLRVLYEHVAVFGWLAIDPAANLKVWVAYDRSERLKLYNDIQRVDGADLLPAEKRAEFEADIEAAGAWPRIPLIVEKLDAYWSTKMEAFRASGRYSFRGMYPVVYRGASPLVHATVESLQRLTSGAPGTTNECVVHADDNDRGVTNAWSTARIIYALGLVLSALSLQFPAMKDVLDVFESDPDGDE